LVALTRARAAVGHPPIRPTESSTTRPLTRRRKTKLLSKVLSGRTEESAQNYLAVAVYDARKRIRLVTALNDIPE
jgi:hypothetical protein